MGLTLKDLLLEEGLVTVDQIEQARREGKLLGRRLGESLIKLGYVEGAQIASMLSRRLSIRAVDPKTFDWAPVAHLLSASIARRYGVIPLSVIPLSQYGPTLTVAAVDPTDLSMLEDLRFSTHHSIEVVVASEQEIAELVERHYGSRQENPPPAAADLPEKGDDIEVLDGRDDIDLVELEKGADEAPVVKLCHLILTDAFRRGADRILLETYEHECRVRFEIDGVLYVVMNPPIHLRGAINNRLKIMARINPGDRGGPQEGEIRFRLKNQERFRSVDMGVKVLPMRHGEMLVIENRPRERELAATAETVFSGLEPDPIERIVAGGRGMIIVTGPPRSGRTTTLLALLTLLDLEGKSVSTFSSEVTFSTLRVSQLAWHDSLSTREAVRSGLSQRPDAVLFDPGDPSRVLELILEGATQRLVFVTMEARDAVSAIRRVLEHPQREKLGIDRETVLRSVRAVTHQRLLRRVCPGCRIEDEAPVDDLQRHGIPARPPLRAKVSGGGCEQCNRMRYRGRVGVFETLVVDEPLRRSLASGDTDLEVRDSARQRGFRTLADHVLQRLENGDVSPIDVLLQSWP